MLKSCFNQCASCGQLLKVFRRTTTRWKNAHCRCPSSSQQGWDLSELACRCSHVTRAAGAEAQLCLCLAVTGKPGHSGVTHGQHCSISLGGKVPECPVGLHPEAGGSGCLQFVSLVSPQQLQKRDLSASLPVPAVSADGNPVWELLCPFLSPLKLSLSTRLVLINCRSSLLFG